MKKVSCELVCHFKEKLLLHGVFSLEFHVENNLNILAMARRQNLNRRIRSARGLRSPKSCTSDMALHRNSRPEVFCKKGFLKNFAKFTEKHLCQSLLFKKVTLAQVFSCEFCEVFKSIL